MSNDSDYKIFQYGDGFYSIDEIYEIDSKKNFDKRSLFRNCISHNILARIFARCHLDREASILESIADLEMKKVDKSFNKAEKVIYNMKFSLYTTKLFLASGSLQKYRMAEFSNGDWLLRKIISLTFGSSYPALSCNDFSLLDYNSLTEEECKAIVANFKRNIRGEDLVFYKNIRTLEKSKN